MSKSEFEVIKKYLEVIQSSSFVEYEKEFAKRVVNALSNKYLSPKPTEIKLVKFIQKIVNNINGLSSSDKNYELSTQAIFIQGKKSMVNFEYSKDDKPRELGDLIFIISIIFKGKIWFQKLTINQFKKDKNKVRNIRWGVNDKKQLYLLSRNIIITMNSMILWFHLFGLGLCGFTAVINRYSYSDLW